MIRHIVLLEFTAEADEASIEALVADLRALPDAIDEIETYDVARDAGLADRNAHLAVIATFADESAWAVYRDHPEHLRIIAEQIRPVLARRSAVQTAH
ncbi:MAG TPA: Dabb family protein [Acidimicrobiales bacterium]|nr:Dabb family protein [Acidimicrobiales bacterium]